MENSNQTYPVAVRYDLVVRQEDVKREEPPPTAEYQAKKKLELEESIKYAEEEQRMLHSALADLRNRIGTMEGDFEEKFASLNALYNELKQRMQELRKELEEPFPDDVTPPPETRHGTSSADTPPHVARHDLPPPQPEKTQPANREERRKEEKKAKKKNSLDEIKKLFRRIAKLCHPDKTTDTNLHGLFREARKLYAARDFDGLNDIWNVLRGDASSLLGNLMAQLATIQEHAAKSRKALNNLRSSASAELLKVYEDPLMRGNAYTAARNSIQSMIDKAVIESHQLLSALVEKNAILEEIRRAKEYEAYQERQRTPEPPPKKPTSLLESVGSKLRLLLSGD